MKKEKVKKKELLEMQVVNLYSARIDISDKEHVLSVAEGLSEKWVRAFGTMTCDLEMLSMLYKKVITGWRLFYTNEGQRW